MVSMRGWCIVHGAGRGGQPGEVGAWRCVGGGGIAKSNARLMMRAGRGGAGGGELASSSPNLTNLDATMQAAIWGAVQAQQAITPCHAARCKGKHTLPPCTRHTGLHGRRRRPKPVAQLPGAHACILARTCMCASPRRQIHPHPSHLAPRAGRCRPPLARAARQRLSAPPPCGVRAAKRDPALLRVPCVRKQAVAPGVQDRVMHPCTCHVCACMCRGATAAAAPAGHPLHLAHAHALARGQVLVDDADRFPRPRVQHLDLAVVKRRLQHVQTQRIMWRGSRGGGGGG